MAATKPFEPQLGRGGSNGRFRKNSVFPKNLVPIDALLFSKCNSVAKLTRLGSATRPKKKNFSRLTVSTNREQPRKFHVNPTIIFGFMAYFALFA